MYRPRVPWFNDELRSLKSKRRKLEKRMRKSNLDSDIRAYRVACNQYCFRLNEAKKKHYGGLIEECAGDSKKLFGVVKSLCNERTDALPPHDNPRQLADEFGEFFYRKIAVIREDIKNCSIPQPVVSIPSPPTKITHFSPVSETQVRDIISSSSNASCQLDPIPTSLLKKSVDVLAPIITRMVNSSLVSGCFMHLSRLTWTIATHCFTAYRSTNSAVYSVSLMPQLASPAFFHGILTSPQRCSISTGFLLPSGSNSR